MTAAELAQCRGIIARQVAHMSALLDVSRTTRGSFVLKKTYVEIEKLRKAAVEAGLPAMLREGARCGASMTTQSVIFVRDTGVGISPEMITEIVNMFTRVDSVASRSDGGLGIGLALAKGLVELHGGRVEAQRGAGQGQ